MATEVKLPRLGQGMESGTIVRWLKAEGDAVRKREPLYELDTDKVTQEVESEVDGVLLKIVVPEGEVEVGSTIAVIEQRRRCEASVARRRRPPPRARRRPPTPTRTAAAEASPPRRQRHPAPAAVGRHGGRIKASPLARRIARERGLDLSAIAGTGPDGRIVAEDVERAPVGGARARARGRCPAPSARGRGRASSPRSARRSHGGSPRPGRRRCSSSASRST